MKKRTFLTGVLVGGFMAGALTLLVAPQSGKKTRRQIHYKGEKALDKTIESGRAFYADLSVLVLKAKEAVKK